MSAKIIRDPLYNYIGIDRGRDACKDAGLHQAPTGCAEVQGAQGRQWLHEIKLDSYRVQVHLNKGKKKVFTRTGLDWTKRFSVIAGALEQISLERPGTR